MSKPLEGIRVLDISRVLAGPWCGQMLADFGAEVIKVERPGEGDDTRGWGPPFFEGDGPEPAHASAYYLCANRGKRGIAIDFTQPEGQRLVRELAARSDVLIENFKVGGLNKYGLDYASLAAVNPRLVYCSITGFGQTGPYADRPGYDFILQGMGGLMSITGPAEDEPGSEPYKAGVALTDIMTGLYATNAVMAALVGRGVTGRGRHIDVALLDVQVATLANQAMNYLVTGKAPRRTGNAHPNIVPYRSFRSRDGRLNIAVGNDGQFARLCQVLGLDLAADPRFATNRRRAENKHELCDQLQAVFETQPAAHWIDRLNEAGVPAGPVNDIAEVFADPQVKQREMERWIPHARLGRVPSVANPVRFSEGSPEYNHPPPTLGEHTDDVLRDVLDLDDASIQALRDQGAVG
ncbi:CaiB/BaiF CoA transferase family protein [Phenylobacterium sp.]|jgi:crotonobetainyl-CoA:carnitine CoA-transferase CaiB-like acyl-CoA transferase|uniref:CaiB/BaiF CoA transferase family protein n=1 Tax=Phenylobacterium sp. TaxID=1871053 RepID=UPI003784F68D